MRFTGGSSSGGGGGGAGAHQIASPLLRGASCASALRTADMAEMAAAAAAGGASTEPLAAGADADWDAVLSAAAGLGAELARCRLNLLSSPETPHWPSASASAAAAAALHDFSAGNSGWGGTLLTSDQALLALLRVTLAALRSAALEPSADGAEEDEDDLELFAEHASLLPLLLQPLLDVHDMNEDGAPPSCLLPVASMLLTELWAAAERCGVVSRPPAPSALFAAWRAGLIAFSGGLPGNSPARGGGVMSRTAGAAAPSALALFADMMAAEGRSDYPSRTSDSAAVGDRPGSASGGVGGAAGVTSPSALRHLEALMAPTVALLRRWRPALAAAYADEIGRSPLALGPPAPPDTPFGSEAGLGDISLRGLSRLPALAAAELLLTPAWAEALQMGDAVASRGCAGGGAAAASSSFFDGLAPAALHARLGNARALRVARAAGWSDFCTAWGSDGWLFTDSASGGGGGGGGGGGLQPAARVAAAIRADEPRRTARAAAAAAAAAVRRRCWRRLVRRLAEGGVLFAGGPGGVAPSREGWCLDDWEDGGRARRRLRRRYAADAPDFAAQLPLLPSPSPTPPSSQPLAGGPALARVYSEGGQALARVYSEQLRLLRSASGGESESDSPSSSRSGGVTPSGHMWRYAAVRTLLSIDSFARTSSNTQDKVAQATAAAAAGVDKPQQHYAARRESAAHAPAMTSGIALRCTGVGRR
jgi:hypothetical protein